MTLFILHSLADAGFTGILAVPTVMTVIPVVVPCTASAGAGASAGGRPERPCLCAFKE